MQDHTHRNFMDIPSARSVEEVPFANSLSRIFSNFQADGLNSTTATVDSTCGGDQFRKEWFTLQLLLMLFRSSSRTVKF